MSDHDEGWQRRIHQFFLVTDPELWSPDHVRAWLDWVLKEFNMEGQVNISTYAQYSGQTLLKMGKKTFCDLSPPNYACDIIWEHLMMLKQGKGCACASDGGK